MSLMFAQYFDYYAIILGRGVFVDTVYINIMHDCQYCQNGVYVLHC